LPPLQNHTGLMRSVTSLNKLDGMENQAMRIISGAIKLLQ